MNQGYHHDRRSSRQATEAITGARFVVPSGDNGIAMADAGEKALGVAPYDIESGKTGTVVETGTVEVDCGDDVAVNVEVTSDGSGKAVEAASNDYACGVAEDAGGDGDKIMVRLYDNPVLVP